MAKRNKKLIQQIRELKQSILLSNMDTRKDSNNDNKVDDGNILDIHEIYFLVFQSLTIRNILLNASTTELMAMDIEQLLSVDKDYIKSLFEYPNGLTVEELEQVMAQPLDTWYQYLNNLLSR